MRRTRLALAGAAALMLLAVPAHLQAQGRLLISLSGAGNVPVKGVTAIGPVNAAMLSEASPVTGIEAVVNAGKGDKLHLAVANLGMEPVLYVAANRRPCQDPYLRRALAEFLAEEQAKAQRAQEAQEAEELCRELGVVYTVGDAAEYKFTMGPDGLELLDVITASLVRKRYTVGLGGRYSTYNKAEEVGCNQVGITACTADNTRLGFQAFAEFEATPWGSIGVRAFRSGYSVNQTYADLEQSVDVKLTGIEATGALYPFGRGRIAPYFGAGWGWWWNAADFLSGGTLFDTRRESGGRAFGELGFDLLFGNSALGARVSGGLGGGGNSDSDFQRYFAADLTFRF